MTRSVERGGLLIVVVAGLLAGCQQLPADPGQARAELLCRIPIGTPLAEAQRALVEYGFRCELMVNQPFAGHPPADYLYGDREEGFLVARRWQVALSHRDGRVTEIAVTTGLTGP